MHRCANTKHTCITKTNQASRPYFNDTYNCKNFNFNKQGALGIFSRVVPRQKTPLILITHDKYVAEECMLSVGCLQDKCDPLRSLNSLGSSGERPGEASRTCLPGKLSLSDFDDNRYERTVGLPWSQFQVSWARVHTSALLRSRPSGSKKGSRSEHQTRPSSTVWAPQRSYPSIVVRLPCSRAEFSNSPPLRDRLERARRNGYY